MADQFSIEAKLKITGVDVKGDLNAGTLKFKVDTSALKKLVSDAGEAAKRVKAKFDNIKLKKLRIDINRNSLRSAEAQIRNAVQNAVQKTKLDLTTSVKGGTKTDPFKAQRQAAGKSAQSLQALHNLTKQVNTGLRSLVRTLGSMPAVGAGAGAAAAPKGALPFPPGAQVVPVGALGRGGGGVPPGVPGVPGFSGGGDNVRKTANAVRQLTANTGKANDKMLTLNELTFQVGRKAAAFRGVAIAINTVVNAAQAATKFVIEFNDSLIEVNKILQLSDRSLQLLGNDLFDLSAKTGVAVDETIAISEAFARAGLAGRGYGTIVQLTNRALTGLQGTTLDAKQASELFIQIIQQVEGGVRGLNKELITTTKLFDVLGKAEDITASRATDVQQAFKRSAASIFATGATIEQATAIISVLQERTQRGGDVIGTALKTLASRISSSTSEATKALNEIGVATIDSQGNLRNLFDVLQDTAIAFQSLTEAEQANVAVKAAGIRQVEVFRAAVQDFNRVQGVQTQLVEASGDAARKQAAEQSKLANSISKIQIALQQIVRTASEGILGEAFVGVIESVEKIISTIANFDKKLGGAVSTFAGLLTTGLAMKVLIPMFGGIARTLKFFIGFQKESAVAMGGIQRSGEGVASTVQGKMNPALEMTAALTAQATANMGGLTTATNAAAAAAERLAMATQAGAGSIAQTVIAGRAGAGGPRGGRDIGGGAITPLAVAGTAFLASQKKVSIFGKVVGTASKGFKLLTKNVLGLGLIASIAGGQLQSFANSLRREGGDRRGAIIADVAGGALGGAGQGALIGSLIAPGVGTVVGALLGAIGGAVPALSRAFDDTADTTHNLTRQMIRLGIVQAENGRITSEVAAQVDKALRDIEGFKTFSVGAAERERRGKADPKEAEKAAARLEVARNKALKTVLAGFDPTKSIEEQNKLFLQALNAPLRERAGDQGFDLASKVFEKGLADFDEETLQAIGEEFAVLLDAIGGDSEALKREIQAEIDLAKALNKTKFEVEEATRVANKRIKEFIEATNTFLPSEKQLTPAAEKAAADFRAALIDLANGVIKETNKRIRLGLAFARKEGFVGAEGTLQKGVEGLQQARAAVEKATAAAEARRNIGPAGVGAAAKPIRDIILSGLRTAVTTRGTESRFAQIEKREEALRQIFEGLSQGRDGAIVGEAVNKLELTLRDFLVDFERQISKLNETRIRAFTPQEELADALAENAQAMLEASRASARTGMAAAERTAQQELSEIDARGQRVFAGLNDIVKQFDVFKDFTTEIQGRLKALRGGTSFKQLIEAGNIPDIAEVFGTDEATAKEILKAGRRTTDTIIDGFFNNLVKAGRKALDKGTVDADQLAEVFKKVREATPDLGALSQAEQEQVVAIAKKFLKTSADITTKGYEKQIKANSTLLDALKTRIARESRLLALEDRRRNIAAMSSRVNIEELTGVRRLVAEREIEARQVQENVAALKAFIATQDKRIARLNAIEKTEKNRATIEDQLKVLAEKRADATIRLDDMVLKHRISGMRNLIQQSLQVANATKLVADHERRRIGALAEIGSLLSVDTTEMGKFNAELDRLSAEFRARQAELAAEAVLIRKIKDPGQRLDRERKLHMQAEAAALEHAKAEAQVIAQRREAIKQVSQELVANQQSQVDAQRAVLEATRGVSDAFENYLQAVDGAIMATTRYNLGLAMAEVETTKITGGFSGMRDQIAAVQDAFRDAENLARDLGASEKTLVEIRRDSINQQLSLFNSLLQEQSRLARSFFTSSTQDQADLFLGIREAGNVAALLGGSFAEFKKKGEGAINDLGAQLLSLPQETRKRVISSLETLQAVGGQVGGFTADELLTAIETASLGVSGEGLQVDPLFEVQQRIALLQEEQARLATEQLIVSQEQIINAKEQLEQAEAAKDLAEIQLERIKEEGEKLRGKLGDLQGQLNTTLLRQEQTQRQGFSAVTAAIARATNLTLTQLPEAFNTRIAQGLRDALRESSLGGPTAPGMVQPTTRPTPPSKGREMAEAQRRAGRDRAALQQQISQAGPSVANQQVALGASLPGAGTGTQADANTQTIAQLRDILTELRELNDTSEANLTVTEEIRDASGNQVGTAAATLTGTTNEPTVNINVEGTTTVTVTGFEAAVARLATTLSETLGGFVSEDEARRIADEVLENIRTELLRRGIITPTTL